VFAWGDDPRPVVKPDPVTPPVNPPGPPIVPDPDLILTPLTGTPGAMVLFDLPQTAIDMFKAGFPGREGVLLYALGQVANGWPIPGESEELALINEYYDPPEDGKPHLHRWELMRWHDKQLGEVIKKLRGNPGLTVTIIANDVKDRFGCRIGPPVYERLKDFGDRVQMGYFVPESEYRDASLT